MKTVKIILLFFVLLISFFGGRIFFREDNKNHIEVDWLRNVDVSASAQKEKSLQAPLGIHVASQSSSSLGQQEDVEVMRSNIDIKKEILNKHQRLAENYKNNKNYDFYEAVLAAYEAETYDEQWAQVRISSLQHMFSTEGDLAGYSIKSIDCKSKHCRIDLFYQNKVDLDRVSSILREKIGDKNKLFLPSVEMNYKEEKNIGSVYLTDDIASSLY